jgi:hypothetical protein
MSEPKLKLKLRIAAENASFLLEIYEIDDKLTWRVSEEKGKLFIRRERDC